MSVVQDQDERTVPPGGHLAQSIEEGPPGRGFGARARPVGLWRSTRPVALRVSVSRAVRVLRGSAFERGDASVERSSLPRVRKWRTGVIQRLVITDASAGQSRLAPATNPRDVDQDGASAVQQGAEAPELTRPPDERQNVSPLYNIITASVIYLIL